jgi:hypothetical protein
VAAVVVAIAEIGATAGIATKRFSAD